MRVAFVIPYFYPAMWYGGTPRAAYETARALVRRGHEVTVLTTDSAGPIRIPADAIAGINRNGLDGIRVHYYRNLSNNLAYRHRIFFPPRFFHEVKSQLPGSDVVHIHELRSLLSVASHSALKSLRTPYVLSPHGGLQHLGKMPAKVIFDLLWGKTILKDAAGICAISPLEETDARMFGIEEHRIHRFPSPIDADPYKELPKPGDFASRWRLENKRIVLFLGRLHWIKGPDILVESISLLNDIPDLHVVIAGPDDGAEVKLRHLVRDMKLKDRITFTGFLDDTQRLKALIDSFAVVVPSRREGFPITMLEALACGKPLVVSSACDLEDWIRGRATWSTFRNGDPADLAEKLKTIFGAGRDPKALSEARNFVLSEFSADALAAKAEALYGSLLKN